MTYTDYQVLVGKLITIRDGRTGVHYRCVIRDCRESYGRLRIKVEDENCRISEHFFEPQPHELATVTD